MSREITGREGKMIGMKHCNGCDRTMERSAFGKCARAKDGTAWRCLECSRKTGNKYARSPKGLTTRRRWDSESRTRTRDDIYRANHRPQFKEWRRKWHLQREYGLTPEEYFQFIADQGGGCGICGQAAKPNRSLPVDHCHKTGIIRGVICDPCNRGLEAFRDSPETIRRAAEYIERERPNAKKVA